MMIKPPTTKTHVEILRFLNVPEELINKTIYAILDLDPEQLPELTLTLITDKIKDDDIVTENMAFQLTLIEDGGYYES